MNNNSVIYTFSTIDSYRGGVMNEVEIRTAQVSCDLCGSLGYTYLYSKSDHKLGLARTYDVVQCTNCGLGFVNPQPLPEETYKLYPDVYYEDRDTAFWMKKYQRRYSYIRNLPGDRILDIGCARGDFLNYIRRYGYEVAGYEEICSDNPHDFPVYSGPPQEMLNMKERYDIITAWAVLEHLQKPSQYFELATNLLKERGFFLFLVTNLESIASRYLYGEDIPRHLTFFSPPTIRMYAEKYGFSVKKIYHRNDVYRMAYIDSLNWFLFKLSKQDFTQHDTLSLRMKRGQAISKPFFVASQLTGRLVQTYEELVNRNGIITALLQKKCADRHDTVKNA
jgi:hypothetical protein